METISFTKGELEALVHLLNNAGIFGCDYDEAVSGIRKLKKAIEVPTARKTASSRRNAGRT